MIVGYDIIGDIHGQASMLEALLTSMGYRKNSDGVFFHPDRQVLFVGDFIDRGPEQAKLLSIVRTMVETGTARAILGNHEFNAICYATPHPKYKERYIREHTERNLGQHEAFLNDFPHGSEEHAEQIAWFKTLPVFLDLKDIFLIHAHWNPESIGAIKPHLNLDNTLTDQAYLDYADKTSPLYHGLELLLKGPEYELPEVAFFERDGHQRKRTRIFWWIDEARPTVERIEYPRRCLSHEIVSQINNKGITGAFNPPAKHLFVGHYWMTGVPAPLSDRIACVDYSAVKGGSLVAYRWNGEAKLSKDNFVCFPPL